MIRLKGVGVGALSVVVVASALACVVTLVGGAAGQPRLGNPAPDVAGGPWIGSEPLTIAALRGRVVLVEFWTHG